MEFGEAVEAMSRILFEERVRPTSRYKQKVAWPVTKEGESPLLAMVNAAQIAAAGINLVQERQKHPRRVQEDADLYEFGGTNYDLMLRLLGEVETKDRELFFSEMLSFVSAGGYLTKVGSETHFPTFLMTISDVPLIAEFCIRTGHLTELFDAILRITKPTNGLVLLLMQLEETISVNFDLFSREELKQIQQWLVPIRAMAEVQTWQTRGPVTGKKVQNPHFKPGRQRQGNEIVRIIDDLFQETNQALFFYTKGHLQKTRNPEVEADKVKVIAFLDTLGFRKELKEALEEAEKQYRDDATAFELKSCFGHLRSFLEILHRDSADAIAAPAAENGGKKWGEWIAYLRNKGIFIQPHEAFITSLYTLMSDTAVHPLTADRDYARLLRNMVIEYGVMFLSKLAADGIKIS
jgi:hypothetical protein